ncbi:YjcZ family sporulation protein [Halalkalibacterium ligniniphilum]|uniref:YjcZ family sporulation protein n=1 Tax=Halalkalibacterium ligniniphilum TaxID=1134413 RepID=UPI0003469971|nr:YjcZ family sporulation protein [Halalkalibacterium ligniniphilum]
MGHDYGYGYGGPVAGQYAPAAGYGQRKCDGFALIVVLFILLIIVGAAMMRDHDY